MWIVGGTAGDHARYEAALGSSHGYEGKVEAWLEGERLGEVLFESGTVHVSGRSRERRRIDNLKIKEADWPSLPSDPFSPFGGWIRCYVRITSGAAAHPWIPVMAGKVTVVDRTRWSGFVAVTAVDPMFQVNAQAFEAVTPANTGTTIPSQILQLLREVFPSATLDDQTGSTDTVPSGLAWSPGDGSRGRALDELAASIGAELFARPTTVWPELDAVLRPVPTLGDDIAWVPPDGDESVVEADRMLQRGDTIANRWIVTAERTDQTEPIREVATDTDSGSATRYDGPMGKLPKFWSSPFVTTAGQAQVAARAKLAWNLGSARPRTIRCIANPALEAGDVLGIGVDGEIVSYHIVDDFDVPLQHDPASMTILTRSI